MSPAFGLVAVLLVVVATLSIGAYGWRFSRTTSDFFVASRSVRPALNASAIGGEYLSAASFLGVAGLVLAFGTDMLWYPVGWTAGYLVLLVLVAAPLRRSGAYTLPDFAEARLESRSVRGVSSLLVVGVGWLYLMPQFQGAGLSLGTVAGTPPWVGGVVVAAVVLVNVLFGGMRSITFVQAFQYWLKLTALLRAGDVPARGLARRRGARRRPTVALGVAAWRRRSTARTRSTRRTRSSSRRSSARWACRTSWSASTPTPTAAPPVVRRWWCWRCSGCSTSCPPCTAPSGGSTHRTWWPRAPPTPSCSSCPARMVGGLGGELLSALTAAGAFAAFLSTSSGLTIAVAGVISQDVMGRRFRGVRAFQAAAVVAVVVPLVLAVSAEGVGVARAVGLAFAVAASTFCPLLVLGIWWRRLTDVGAIAGMVVGGLLSGAAVVLTLLDVARPGWPGALLSQPAAWTVPVAFATMVAGSLLDAVPAPGARLAHDGPAAHPRGRGPGPRTAAALTVRRPFRAACRTGARAPSPHPGRSSLA